MYMAGILDKKTRFIDFIITEQGREKLAKGKLRPVFASFTDKNCFYDKTDTNIKNSSNYDRIQLESQFQNQIDKIVFETDDSGKLFLYSVSGSSVVGNKIFQEDSDKTSLRKIITTGSIFASVADTIKSDTIKNFRKNMFIRTLSGFDQDDKNFKLSHENYSFVISNSVPFPLGPRSNKVNIDSAEPLMFDSKLSHFKNFQYLPPKNVNGTNYGTYQDFRNTTKETLEDIKNDLRIKKIDFDPLAQEDTVINYTGDDVRVLNRAPLKDINTKIAKEYTSVSFKNITDIIFEFFDDLPKKPPF